MLSTLVGIIKTNLDESTHQHSPQALGGFGIPKGLYVEFCR
jgi:hypothetical protein